ncbi:hypothetical protein [Segniliparus rugosus]|uniref:Uncharacterized protein n=1 Tax=Segniliparus rugosus (strain ATCC BAA-974 / DSM 45345 / CCUG 50838 / CIP 108380 / JCM 13579 / CDC 945) TaxID=679197 RepID=E5XTR3_SEGRC|nr:hypothetical protein [Segniliparus rugosus]EFV12266.1 hypothetical protein HMPREF9336_02885 [Segniliparus rugosus ATCC BAA-974]
MADKDDPTTHEGAAAEAEAEEATNDDSATGSAKDDAAQGKASDDSATESAEDDAAQDKASDDKQKKKSSDGAAKSEEEPKDKGPSRAARVKQRVQSGFSWRWAAAGAVIVALGGVIVFGSFRYRDVTRDLAQVHQEQADRDKAAQMAKDYALKSLTYTWQDPDGFFKSVEDGVAPPLKDKYLNVAELLKGIMAQAKVESSGEILAADVTPNRAGPTRSSCRRARRPETCRIPNHACPPSSCRSSSTRSATRGRSPTSGPRQAANRLPANRLLQESAAERPLSLRRNPTERPLFLR